MSVKIKNRHRLKSKDIKKFLNELKNTFDSVFFNEKSSVETGDFEGMKIIAVTHFTGMREPNFQELTDENRKKFESKGGIVLTTTHAFMGIGAAMRKKFNMYLLGDVVANTLRIFGQGMKVVCEITLMAADAGLVETGEDNGGISPPTATSVISQTTFIPCPKMRSVLAIMSPRRYMLNFLRIAAPMPIKACVVVRTIPPLLSNFFRVSSVNS